MKESTSREKVLKKVRNALISRAENPYPMLDLESPIFRDFTDDLDITFAQSFTRAGGKFIYCENTNELQENLSTLFSEKKWDKIFCIDSTIQEILKSTGIEYSLSEEDFLQTSAGITGCEFLIARFGSIMVSSAQASGRRLNVFPEFHLVIATTDQIVPELKDALVKIRQKYPEKLPSLISVITGPSRTADIEKTLVMGAHGPKEVYLFLTEAKSGSLS
jgi:L-lactate dehydrogenase complex protein LldG